MDLDKKLGTYFREKEAMNTKFRNDSRKQKNQELIKKSPANKLKKTKKVKKGFFAKLFG